MGVPAGKGLPAWEPVEIPGQGARGRFGRDGMARATSMSTATCAERATQPDSPKLSRHLGCAAFSPFPALLVDYPATAGRVCPLLAPRRNKKSAATRHR